MLERGRLAGMIRWIPVAVVLIFLSLQPWGWQIGLPIGLVGLGWLMYGLYSYSDHLQKEIQLQEAHQRLTLLSQKRHDWMNHVQVLMAYETVKRTEQIRPYLQRLARQAAVERQLGEMKYPFLALALVPLPGQYPEWQWHVVTDKAFHLSSVEEEQQMAELIQVITDHLASLLPSEGEPEMKIIFGMEEQQPFFRFVSDGLIWLEYLLNEDEQGKLREKLQEHGGEGKLLSGEGIQVRLQRKKGWRGGWREKRKNNRPPSFPT